MKIKKIQKEIRIGQANTCIQNNEVVNMPKVVIVKPNNSEEQTQRVLRNIANVMEKIIQEEFGVKVRINLFKKLENVLE